MTELEPNPQATIDAPRAVRVRTSTGWADLAIKGAPGPPGPIGATGAASTVPGPVGPQGPAGAPAYPTPVVNGQWIKGVGGAAVWSAIADADVPAIATGRLSASSLTIADYNNAINNGWYFATPGTPNQPPVNDWYAIASVMVDGFGSCRQTAYAYQSDSVFMRRLKDGAWGAWRDLAGTIGAFGVYPSGPTNMLMQWGSANVAVVAQTNGAASVYVPLAHPWPNQHVMSWLTQTWPLASWGISLAGLIVSDLGGFSVNYNSPVAQNIAIGWMSLGN